MVLLAGNQFMVLPQLVARFLAAHDHVTSVFYETLPPGLVLAQFRRGGLRLGTLELRVRPDVLALAPARLAELHAEGLVGPPRTYASNDLALLVRVGNPAGISGWSDLLRPGIRVALPDPRTEGIGELALAAIQATGGAAMRRTIEHDKRRSGEVVLTSIHHRQSPAWLTSGDLDVAVVWSTEARHHLSLGAPFDVVALPAEHNRTGAYAAAAVIGAPHPRAAAAFVDYLCSDAGRSCFAEFGFRPAEAPAAG